MAWQQRLAIAMSELNPLPPTKQRLVGVAWGTNDAGTDDIGTAVMGKVNTSKAIMDS